MLTQTKIDNIELVEWTPQTVDLNKEDIDFLLDFKDKITVSLNKNGKYSLIPKNHIGTLVLPSGKILRIFPKIGNIRLIKMIDYTYSTDINFREITTYEKGTNFIDLIAVLFINSVKEIFKQGLYKSYVNRNEHSKFIRGSIDLPKQINSILKNKFYCNYDDLCFDIIENQILLKSAVILLPLISEAKIKKDLNYIINSLLYENVSLKDITRDSFKLLNINRNNNYYLKSLTLCKLIIKSFFVKSLSYGKSKAVSFLLNMNELFESFISKLLEELNPKKTYLQRRNYNLLIPHNLPNIILKPDIVLYENNKPILIIDTKYKNIIRDGIKNSDIYQMVCYSLSNKTDSILIYPKTDGKIQGYYEILEKEYKIMIDTIDIYKPEKTFIEDVKTELKQKLQKWLKK